VSIGVGVAELSDSNASALIKRADERLYQAKAAGRNRVFSTTQTLSAD